LEALERRVIVKSQHIKQAKLETDEGAYQSGEQLEEDGSAPGTKLAEAELLEEMDGQNSSKEVVESEYAGKC
jgi:hypothetical protein